MVHKIIQRLKSFETRVPKPALRRFSRPIPVHANIDNKELFLSVLIGKIKAIHSHKVSHVVCKKNSLSSFGCFASLQEI